MMDKKTHFGLIRPECNQHGKDMLISFMLTDVTCQRCLCSVEGRIIYRLEELSRLLDVLVKRVDYRPRYIHSKGIVDFKTGDIFGYLPPIPIIQGEK